MHIEVLTEDKSGGVVVDVLIQRILTPFPLEYTLSVRPHRGKGDFPDDPHLAPGRFASGLLDLLPAKLRAYDRIYAGTPFILIVIIDSDNEPFEVVREKLSIMIRQYAPGLSHVIGICVEETEAWLLGDREAILCAYPDADEDILDLYEQDSICGTWEVLCKALLRERASSLIRVGYPAIGQYKHEWAEQISAYLDPQRNISPSFRAFLKELHQAIRQLERVHV